MYKVSSHSNHLLKAGRPRTFPAVGSSGNIESSSRRAPNDQNGSGGSSQSDCQDQPTDIMTSPKLTFKKTPKQNYQNGQPARLTQGHEEMLRFVHESWHKVMQEFEAAKEKGSDKVVYYDHIANGADNALANFKPFDLEEWCVQRMLQTVGIDPSISA